MSQLICPECDDPLEVDEEWLVTDRSLIGSVAGDLQGDYAHAECLEGKR